MNDDIINLLGKMLGLLDQLSEEKGVPSGDKLVDKNIIKADKSPFDNGKRGKSSLISGEKRRLTETFSLFNKLFFDYQKKETVDVSKETVIEKIDKDQKRTTQVAEPKKEKGGLGLMSMIVGGLALLAASVGAIIASLSGFFGDAGGKVMSVIGKLGMMGALKMLSMTVLKRFALPFLKKLPFIGGIIGLTFAYQAFKDGKFFKGVGELLSALLNFVPIAGPWLSMGADLLIAFAESKGMFDDGGSLSTANGWNTIKGWVASLGKVIMDNALYLPVIGGFKRFGMAYDEFGSGNIGGGLKQLGLGLMTFIGGGGIIKGLEVLSGWLNSPKEGEEEFNTDNSWMGRLKSWIKKKLKDLPEWLAAPLRWFGILDDKENDTKVATDGSKDASAGIVSYVTGVWDSIKGPMGDAVDSISKFSSGVWDSTKKYVSTVWNSLKTTAPKYLESIYNVGTTMWNSIKEVSSNYTNYLKDTSGKIWGSMKDAGEAYTNYLKDTSGKIWGAMKTAASWYTDYLKGMGEKVKNTITEWIPKIIDTVSSVADNALSLLKELASKIGGWVMGLGSLGDKNTTTQINQVTSTTIMVDENFDKVMGKWISVITNNATKVGEDISHTLRSLPEKNGGISSIIPSVLIPMAPETSNVMVYNTNYTPSTNDTEKIIPQIVDSMRNVNMNLTDKLGQLVGTFGEWVSKIILTKVLDNTTSDISDSSENKYSNIISTGTNPQLLELGNLRKLSENHNKLLIDLVNIGTDSLRELKRVSGNSSNSGGVIINQSSPTTIQKQMVETSNNRGGYLTSPYAIG